ncbi:MAG: hypothetical protein ACLRFI_03515 [Alphaproteobacteria bacterium]
MSERPDWELFYHNIYELLYYVQEVNTPDFFTLHWNSNSLHKTIVTLESPDFRKSHEDWLHERIQEDSALSAYWEKYYNPKLYNNGLPPYPYEIDVFLEWKYYGGDRATNGITLLPSDTYKTIVERVLKKFSYMISSHLRQDWFCLHTHEHRKGFDGRINGRLKYKAWQERIRNTQSALNNSR